MDELHQELMKLRQRQRAIVADPASWCGGIVEPGFMKPAVSKALRALDRRSREVLIEILSMQDE